MEVDDNKLTGLTLDHLFVQSVSRSNRWHTTGLDDWSPLEWAGAMCGEAGEAANAAKKLKRLEGHLQTHNGEGRHYAGPREARLAVAREVADTILYGLMLLARVGYHPEPIIREVFNAKSEEYGFPERV